MSLEEICPGIRDFNYSDLEYEIPEEWVDNIPEVEKLVDVTIRMCPLHDKLADEKLMRRRDFEYEKIFKKIEAKRNERVKDSSLEKLEKHFIGNAQARKVRSGKSLEFHVKRIMEEEGFEEGKHFKHQQGFAEVDFLFFDRVALAVKNSFKDKWRQITHENPEIPEKHLLTTEIVPWRLFNEMKGHNITFVIPEELHKKYDMRIQSQLKTVEEFINELILVKNDFL